VKLLCWFKYKQQPAIAELHKFVSAKLQKKFFIQNRNNFGTKTEGEEEKKGLLLLRAAP